MQLSSSEKLILIMLSEIYQKLDIDPNQGIDPEFVQEAIYTNNTWGLNWKYQGIFDGSADSTPPEVNEVVDYLDMWTFVESAIGELTADQLLRLEEKTGLKSDAIKFNGFDGNNESRYFGIANFLIQKLDRFTNFKDRYLNSHMQVIGGYRRMHLAFEPMRRMLVGQSLSLEQLVEILNSRRFHP